MLSECARHWVHARLAAIHKWSAVHSWTSVRSVPSIGADRAYRADPTTPVELYQDYWASRWQQHCTMAKNGTQEDGLYLLDFDLISYCQEMRRMEQQLLLQQSQQQQHQQNSTGYVNDDELTPQPSICDAFNADLSEYNALKARPYMVVSVVLCCVVILVGGIGNVLVVITVARSRHMWNATNIFIANLAVADVFVLIFCLPLSGYYQITEDWIFGSALCHVIPPLWGMTVYVSTLTLTMIAIDRFILIVYPLRQRMTPQLALMMVLVIVAISSVVAVPLGIFSDFVEVKDPALKIDRSYCVEEWPTQGQRQMYTILTLIFQFFVPLIMIGILYVLIFRSLHIRLNGRAGRRTRTTKMLMAVVLAFCISYIPFHTYALMLEFDVQIFPRRYVKFVDVLLLIFAMSSSCVNPFLYAWMNDNFRNAFAGMFCHKLKGNSKTLQTLQDTEGASMAMTPLRSRRDNRLRYIPENSKANDVSVAQCTTNGTGNGLTVPDRIPYKFHINTKDVKEDSTAVNLPLLKKP